MNVERFTVQELPQATFKVTLGGRFLHSLLVQKSFGINLFGDTHTHNEDIRNRNMAVKAKTLFSHHLFILQETNSKKISQTN